jgi:phosphate transport system permease protein
MLYFLTIIIITIITFYFTRKTFSNHKKHNNISSIPQYYGYCSIIWLLISALITIIVLVLNKGFSNNLFLLIFSVIAICTNVIFKQKYFIKFHARNHFEKIFLITLKIASLASIAITFFIIASILLESIKFFKQIPLTDFLFGTDWNPQIAMREDQAATAGSFGAIPILLGTFLITFIAIIIAVPLGILSAIYLTEYANNKFRKIAKPTLEILAGIPTVVYGYFAAFTVAPFLQLTLAKLNINIASESALTAGLVMGIMIIPFVLSLSDDVMNTVPKSLRDASLSMGATPSETIKKVVIPAALPGIIGAILLAISRAVGETMIVTMAAGLNANLTINPLNSVTTATAQIVTLLTGDQEFDSVKTLAAFALGITLFTVTLILNIIALIIVKKYREKYE